MDWATSLGYVETQTPQQILAIRLLLAGLFGAMIGFERESNNGSAGLRTHILVAVAACLFTLLAFEIYNIALDSGVTNTDPIRAVEATTAGIAFLGAGAIFQQRGNVRGLTTGAGMWLAGAVGVSTALGYYAVAFGVALFAVLVLAALKAFAHRAIGDGDKADEGSSKG
ncbi:MAG: MgtC/SapB family protein [Hyphomicrobiales bacterium]|nr:MAG: MgtC/SapB family protein [Hyphomicrobiales bacterium]